MAGNENGPDVTASSVEQQQSPELIKLEDDVSKLLDDNEANDVQNLSDRLNSNFVNQLSSSPDFANKLLDAINASGKANNEQLKPLITILNSIKNKVKIQEVSADINTENKTESIYSKLGKEGFDQKRTELLASLEGQIGQCGEIPELQDAKNALQKVTDILNNPNKENIKTLQTFILKNLEGKDKNDFLKGNFKGQNEEKPDGVIGQSTLEKVNTFINKCTAYINNVIESKNIQANADKLNSDKPNETKTDNADTGLDDLSTNVDYQALQSFAKLAEASEAASQAISAHQEELKALIDNGKIDKELVNKVQGNTESFLKRADELKIYQSVGQLSNMISDYNNKNNQLNDINKKITQLQSEGNNETQIAELQEQANNLKSEMDNLNLSIMETKREYGVTMLGKDALQQKLNDGLHLAVNIIKDGILMINQILLALDNNEESGNEELKKTLKDYQNSLLTVSGFKIENGNVVPDNNAPSWSMSKYTILRLDTLNSDDLLKSYPFFNPEMKSKLFSGELPNGDKAARMDIRDITYTVNVDRNGNICPIATASDKHLIGSDYPVMFKNSKSCINYLQNKAMEAGLTNFEIARNDSMKDYVLRSHEQGITIEPMTIAGERISKDLSTCLKLLNLTNYIRSKGEPDLKYKYSIDEKGNKYLIIRGSRGKQTISLSNFGLNNIADEELKKFIKYNNHEERNEDWDKDWNKKKSSDYKRITL